MGHEEELSPDQVDLKVSPLVGSLRRTWGDFCATSSIHGLRYTRDEDTNKIVHLVWLLISLVMFCCAVVMAHTFYMDYRSSPTRMNVESDHTPVSNLYFPPVTICPDVLFNMQKSKAFLKTILNFTAERAKGGFKNGLSVIVRYKDDSYDPVQSYSYGVKLLIQEVDAFPSAHAAAKFVAFNTETFAALRPQETFCSTAVKALTIEERNCVFQNEFPLRYFPDYVYPNCELNCRVTNMVKFCGCHTYFFDFNRTTDRICTFRDIPCLIDNFENIITRKKSTQCDCPLACEHLDYDVQVTNFPLELNMPVADKFYSGLAKNDGILHVFINSFSYRRLRRDLLSNMVTLVSNLGSAFSLFVGMSMLSVVEIIYYFTVILRKNYIMECETRNKMLNKVPKFARPKANDMHSKHQKSVFIIHKS
ncbi:hypothetical protein M5D96_007366 [Drosophila gunungcola]|uniref:Sodium channel protein Nach n=1 Tax=Drosophila gunungcola TaxID=103775 RepID=A0A9P9YN18_9MUSC|nr:hypothetical protein M5D96_007366 [Drosophila gunungcola]